MKYLKYLLIAAITGLFTAACAKEDPIFSGALNPKFTVSQVTATTADITIDLTDCAELIPDGTSTCYVSITEGYYAEEFTVCQSDNPEKQTLTGNVSFKGLQPSTTYHFNIAFFSRLKRYYTRCRSDDFTFTTAKEGDYSAITKLEPYEILISDNLCEIGFKSNFLMYLESIVISENSDLSLPISLLGSTVKTNHYDGYTEYIITFSNLKPNTIYYWAVSGRFNTSVVPLSQEYRSEIFKFSTKMSVD